MDITIYAIAACMVIGTAIVSALFFKEKWWFFVIVSCFLAAVFISVSIMQTDVVPKDLPLALVSNSTMADESIMCYKALANDHLIVEGDFLFCRQELTPKPSFERATFTTFVIVKSNGSIKKLKEVASAPGVTEFSFIIPKTTEFSFEVEAAEGNEVKTITPVIDVYSLEGWFTIRTKKDVDDYMSKVNLALIATILSISGFFLAGNQARMLWQNK